MLILNLIINLTSKIICIKNIIFKPIFDYLMFYSNDFYFIEPSVLVLYQLREIHCLELRHSKSCYIANVSI